LKTIVSINVNWPENARLSDARRVMSDARRKSAPAMSAGAEDLNRVFDVGKSVLLRDRGSPALDYETLDLLGPTAGSADYVVVMGCSRIRAIAVGRFAIWSVNDVNRALVSQRLKVAIHGRESDCLTGAAKRRVDVLCAAKSLGVRQRFAHDAALPGFPAANPTGTHGHRLAIITTRS
jgi:hypothetical protein